MSNSPLTKKDGIILLVGIGLISLCTVFYNQSLFHQRIISNPVLAADIESKVGCGSDSMGVGYRCGDKLYGETIEDGDVLYPGSVYVYDNSAHKKNPTVHRLIICLDDGCNTTVFKGDNNKVGEIVYRKDIQYRVVMKTE